MMAEREFILIVVLLVLLPIKDFSQQQTPRSEQKNPHIIQFSKEFHQKFAEMNLGYRVTDAQNYSSVPERWPMDGSIFLGQIATIVPDYYSSTLGFFCRQELRIEKKLLLPLRLRVGSLQYTDKMEGKLNCQ